MGNIYLRAHILPTLQFTTTFSPNLYHGRNGIFYAAGVTEDNPQGSMYNQKNHTNYGEIDTKTRFDWTWDNQIDYNLTLGKEKEHSISAMGLFSLYKSNTETALSAGKGISDDRLSYNALDKASGDKTIGSSYTEDSLVSFAACPELCL